MKKFTYLALAALLMAGTANAQNTKRWFQDAKYPTQQMVEKQEFTNLAAASTNNVLSAHAGSTSAAVRTITSGWTNPGHARNLVITPGGTTGDVESCTVVVAGTNSVNAAFSEDFAFTANQSTATTGVYAFNTLTSVTWPANCESGSFGATWSIGGGELIGVKRCMANAGDIFFSLLNGAKEGTAPTMAVDADEAHKNTADFNGTMNGTNDFVLYFMQNYGCYP